MLFDLRYAVRQLLKNPGFFVVAVLTLSLAIGANTAIFSAADAVLLHPLAYPDPDRVVILSENMTHYALRKIAESAPEFEDIRRWSTSFSQMGAVLAQNIAISGDGEAANLFAERVTASSFPMLGVKPIVGSLFSEDNERPGNDHVVLISRALWMKRFGGDRSVAGRKVQLNRETYQVLGVIDPIYEQRGTSDLWTPLSFRPQDIVPGSSAPHNIDVIARLKHGVTMEQARDEMRRVAHRFIEQYRDNYQDSMGFSIDVDRLAENQAGNLKTPLLVLISAVGALMLIACANVSNLLLARAMLRRKEMSIRAALGAARSRVIRQLLTESLLLALLGGSLGVLLAFFALRLYTQVGPQFLIRGAQPAISAWVLGFSLAISIAASVLFGIAPAIDTSRTNLAENLKEGARGSSGGRRALRESMVAVEVAVSLILLIGAGLLIRSFVRLANTNPGFRTDSIMTAQVVLPINGYGDPARRSQFIHALLDRIRAIPGVRSAASVDFIPYNGGAGSSIAIHDHPPDPNTPTQVVYQSRVSPGYLRTMGVPLLRGRDFVANDELGCYAIVDETVVKKFYAKFDALGSLVNLPLASTDCTVIGVAGATKSFNLAAGPPARIYYFGKPVTSPVVTMIVQTVGDPTMANSAIRRDTAALDPNLPVTFKTMASFIDTSLARERFSIQLMGVFSALAAILAAIGIYGVLAYLVDQRRRELGIRKALGAREGDMIGLVVRQGSIPVGAGLIVGLAGAFALTRLIKSLLYEVSTTDPLIFAALPIGLVVVALIAMAVPASRAAHVDPLVSLRDE
ncbi:MAG TPA: ABC transporter permease [Bryobacteraceae bacterium]|nr:ABC transporter permease [Bryobacteraceae bacterium]